MSVRPIAPIHRVSGFSLIELMIALVAGLIVIGSVLAFTVSTVRAYNENIRSMRLTQDLRTAMNLMVREARRTGYDASAVTRVLTDNNPSPSFAGLNVSAASDCFTYQYDRGDAFEFRAYRLNSTTGTIQANVGTSAVACDDTTGWVDVSDPAVVDMTDFVVKKRTYPFCAIISGAPNPTDPTKTDWVIATGQVANVGICLQGKLRRDAAVSRAIFDTARLRAENVNFATSTLDNTLPAPTCPTPTADQLATMFDTATQGCVTP